MVRSVHVYCLVDISNVTACSAVRACVCVCVCVCVRVVILRSCSFACMMHVFDTCVQRHLFFI